MNTSSIIFYFLIILCSFSNSYANFANSPKNSYKFDLAVCAIFKNEAPYLKEWIEYHKIVGVQHFYLYNNESSDDYLEVLASYLADGSVELVNWNEPNFQFSGQKKAYMDAIVKVKGIVKWLAVIDIDEYLVPKTHDNLPNLLVEYENFGGLCVNWQMFGTSNVPELKPHELLTENLVLKAPSDYHENLHIKSIVRPERVVEPPHVHYFEYQNGYFQVNSNKENFPKSQSPYVLIDKIQINHYWTKDETFFYKTKVPRRLEWADPMEVIKQRATTLNTVRDESIFRFLPQLKAKMKHL